MMKIHKYFFLVLCIVCILGLAFRNASNDNRSVIVDEESSDIQKEKNDPYIDTITVTADLAVNYDDYKKLVADAEVIVIGTVCDVKGVLNNQGLICSEITLDNPLFLKGPSTNRLIVLVPGGIISVKEFYLFNEQFLRAKLTDEEYDKQLNDITDDDYACCDYMGVDNPRIGDNYLLFLTFDEDYSRYVVTGSCYYGKYVASGDGSSFMRIISGETVSAIGRDELFEAIDTVPDNSEYLKEQRLNTVFANKDWNIEERDPNYDKYKGND